MRMASQRGSYRHTHTFRVGRLLEQLESRLLLSAAYPDLRNFLVSATYPSLPAGMDVYSPQVVTPASSASTPGLSISGYTQSQPILATGSVLTVNGMGFVSGSTVRIGGTTWASVSYISATQLQVTLPAMSNANAVYSLEVVNPDGQTGAAVDGVAYGQVLDHATPEDVPLSGGVITVYGGGFEFNTTFTIDGVATTNVTILSPRQATMTAPARVATGPAAIMATTGGSTFTGTPKFGYAAPYMNSFFGYNGVQAARAKYNDPFYADYKRTIHSLAQQALASTPDTDQGHNAGNLNALLWGYLLEGDPAYRTRLMAEANEVATVVGWPTYEPTAGMRPIHMAEVYNALTAELSTSERNLFETYLKSVIASGSSSWGDVTDTTGSNIVAISDACGGMAGLALLHLNYPGAQAAVNLATSSLNTNYMNRGIRPDGGAIEGTLYWEYGLTYYLEFAHSLQARTGSDQGLLTTSALQNNYHFVETMLAADPITQIQTFADTQPYLTGVAIGADLGSRFNQPLMRWLSDEIMRGAASTSPTQSGDASFQNQHVSVVNQYITWAFNWRDHVASPAQCPALPTLSVLANDTQRATMRTDSSRYPDMEVSVKGGTLPPHTYHDTNYDLGSFVLQANQESYLIDPGYFRGYSFDGDQTFHTVPLIDGNGINSNTSAPIVNSFEQANPTVRGIVVDSSGAYLNNAAQRDRRTIVMTQVGDIGEATVVLDDIVARGAGNITAQYQTGFATQILSLTQALVTGKNGRLLLQTFGPTTNLTVSAANDWWNSWIFYRLGVEWHTVSGSYTANVNQPLVTVLMPTDPTGSLPTASVQYGAGTVDVTLPYGQVIRFTQTAGVWSYSAVVGPSTPLVSVVARDSSADELGQDPGTFLFYRTGSTAAALTVNYSLSGTAAANDYAPTLAGSVTIPAGASSATVVITPVDDANFESDETLTLTLTDAAAYDPHAGTSVATVTILNDDGPPLVTVVATDPAASEFNTTTGTFTVSRNKARPEPLTVFYSMSGTADNGTDYSGFGADNPSLTGSVTIPAGQTSVTVRLAANQDGVLESPETAILTLDTNSGYTIGTQNSATVTITDTPILFSEYFNGYGSSNLPVVFGYGGDGLNGGDEWPMPWHRTASYGDDSEYPQYLAGQSLTCNTPGYLNTGNNSGAANGAMGQLVNNRNDRLIARATGGLTGTIWISGLVKFTSGSWNPIQISLDTNNSGGSVSNSLMIMNEGNAANPIAHLRYNGMDHPLPWSSGKNLTENTSYLYMMKIVMNSDGASDTVSVWINPASVTSVGTLGTPDLQANGVDVFGATFDYVGFGAEQGNVIDAIRISNDPNAFTLVTKGAASSTPTVTILATDPSAAEQGQDPGTFTVTRTDTSGNLTVNYSIGGTATNNVDYTPSLTGSVTIASGQSSAAITLTPVDDTLVEGSETVILMLASGSGYSLGSPNTATVTIADNDSTASGGTLISEYWNGYGSSSIPIVATANSYGLNGGTNWPSAWYRSGAYGLDGSYPQYLPGQSLTCTNVTGYLNTGASDGAMGQPLNGIPGSEDSNTRLIARATGGLTGTIWISALVAFTNGSWNPIRMSLDTNNSGGNVSDYLTIMNEGNAGNPIAHLRYNGTDYPLAWSSAKSLNENTPYLYMMKIVMNADGASDNVSVWINPANVTTEAALGAPDLQAGGADVYGTTFDYVGFGVKNGNIIDALRISNDPANGFISVTQGTSLPTVSVVATANADEQAQTPGTYTITRTGETTGDLTIHYTLAGTATNGTDYATLSGSVVIPDGQTSATITVVPVDDNLAEGTETVLLTLGFGTGYTVGTPNSATVSIADKFSTGGTWTDLDLGGPGATGSVSCNSATQTFTVSGAGADIGGTTDSFNYFYQPLVGDGTIIARVPSVQNTHSAAKAGLMIRNTLDATSAQAMVAVTPSNAVSFLTRTTIGGSTTSSSASGLGAAPYWLKLVRSGNVLTAYASSDPATAGWTQVGSPTTIAMNQTVYVGLAVASHVAGTLCAATFDRMALTVNQLPASGVTLNVGTLQLAPGTTPNTLFQIPSLAITGGTLDLTNNDLLVTNGATQEQAVSTHLLPVPAANGTTTPITTTGVLTGTAYTALYGASFHGQPLTPNALVLQYTRAGDSDLSGQISMDDYLATDAGYLFGRSSNGTWATGDYNHDGKVTAADYALVDQNFRAAGAPMAGALLQLHTAWFGSTYLTPAPTTPSVTPSVPTTPPVPTVPSHPLPPAPLPTAPLNNPVWWTFPSTHPTLQARITLSDDLTLDLLGHPASLRSLFPARPRPSIPFVRIQGPIVSK